MANAKKCDRCGNYYQDSFEETIARTFIDLVKAFCIERRKKSEILERLQAEIDFCPSCSKSFKKWMKGKED